MFFTHRRILFLGLVGTPYDSLKNRTGHRLHVGIFLPDFARRFQSFKELNEISFVTASSNGP